MHARHARHGEDASADTEGNVQPHSTEIATAHVGRDSVDDVNADISSQEQQSALDTGAGCKVASENSTASGPKLVSFRSMQRNKFSSSFIDTEDSMAQSVHQIERRPEDRRRNMPTPANARVVYISQADARRESRLHPGMPPFPCFP